MQIDFVGDPYRESTLRPAREHEPNPKKSARSSLALRCRRRALWASGSADAGREIRK
eukprot:CAMPEP_0181203160 /NCGR_PEP_ID=MMETSP1096-20121128/19235_1 /TAXON_ID=156174 ORGANISM="Chrysochromulina ericina, Strain CCMP281" /NCGR_SAMPLE_ID=MMETSP1096 /ASSEMBLY_ACC=CAM_ASM_000453 /LENGTH=56 /DNA_ID=CAMNT_0023293737 /DNA_START=135 /DNA_END=305 /DNA_ORIENTATION=-